MEMDQKEESKTDFVARPYQQMLLEICIKENTIIYLPTGAGKTFIAVQAIRHFSKDLVKSINEGGKRTIFLVNTVVLAKQQKDCIEATTALDTAVYTGANNVDAWSRSKWREEIDQHQVIVATTQVILDVIRHGYITVRDINLIIFDECHHAVGGHPMHQLMSQFEGVPKSQQPRVIGLTGMLIAKSITPENVVQNIEKLENTFMSVVRTVNTFKEFINVLCFSTKPRESVITYESLPQTGLTSRINMLAEKYIHIISEWKIDQQQTVMRVGQYRDQFAKPSKTLINFWKDFVYQTNDSGVYGASIAILSVLIEMEMKKKASQTRTNTYLYRILSTGTDLICHMLETEMKDLKYAYERVLHYGSPKIKKLFVYLENYLEKNSADNLKCLVFVKRRYTAKCLYHIIKSYANQNPLFPIHADYMVGVNNHVAESIETILEHKWNRRVIEKFRKGEINLIVASSVLEEGVDLQMCNLVIAYDCPETFRSYIQSKGRARMDSSDFVIMVPNEDLTKVIQKIDTFKEVDKKLKECLLDRTVDRKMPLQSDVHSEIFTHEAPPYYTKIGAKLETHSAIQLLNRYCSNLPRDKFSLPTVIWRECMDPKTKKYTVKLKLPIQATLKEEFISEPSTSLDMAKRSVAYKACVKLYENKELNEHLLPISTKNRITDLQNEYFQEWGKFKDDDAKTAGTKKKIRPHQFSYPEQLVSACPKVNSHSFLYIIKMNTGNSKFNSSQNDEGIHHFKNLINETTSYGILTTKKLPKLPTAQFFLSIGLINVEIKNFPKVIQIKTENELKYLKKFHYMLFKDLLHIWKQYFVYDENNIENSYLIVPTKDMEIDWDLVQRFQKLAEPREKSIPERLNMSFKAEDYLSNVLTPWYRADYTNLRYIVTKVLEYQTPKSAFPNDEYTDFAEYYEQKYHQNVVNNEQFLIEVKGITTRLNRLHPLDEMSIKVSKKMLSVEVLIPELCHNFAFPGSMWLKAILLPSTLHRLHYMLHAENLRSVICKFLKIDDSYYIPDPLDIDKNFQNEEYHEKKQEPYNSLLLPNPNKVEPIKMKNTDFKTLSDIFECPWKESEEPIDVDRHWDEVFPVDIDYFYYFVNNDFKKLSLDDDAELHDLNQKSLGAQPCLAICDVTVTEKQKNSILHKNELKSPQLKNLLKAITTSSSMDVFDMEKFEVLGDSYLKIIISLYVFHKYPKWHEGYLSSVRSNFVSNRNLLYCGIKFGLPKIMKVLKFNPQNDWQPPLFTIPVTLRGEILSRNIPPNALYRINLSEHEIENGYIKKEKLQEFIDSEENENNDDRSSLNNFLYTQYISDKAVSDSIEAILGVCVDTCGLQNSLGVLQLFDILPKTENIQNLFSIMNENPVLKENYNQCEIDDHLVNYYKIEEKLGYKFKNRGYLLQALTHPSYLSNYMTNCYQQLEFLGDAVLDFLITSYIFEHGNNLDPGKLTDLRSALVNNTTLACIIVRYDFHLFMLHDNPMLAESIKNFVSYQKNHNHEITDQVQLLVEEDDMNLADFVDVPKSLGDIFESIIGAIFLDSNKSLLVTWNVIYKLMDKEIHSFLDNIPLQLVRQLYEYPKANPKFSDPVMLENGQVMVDVRFTKLDKVLQGTGFGQNKEDAKKAAAKIALNQLKAS